MARTSERSEKELNIDINAAIAGTEDEIFTDAMGTDELDNDGDHDLEEMGEGLEGEKLEEDEEDTDEEDAEEEEDEEVDEDAEEEDDASEDDEEEEVEASEEPAARDERGRFDRREPRIPPERLRHEAEARRQAEQRAVDADQRYQILEARFNDMQARLNAPQPQKREEQQAPPAKPDMFSEPEKYEQWIFERARESARQDINQTLAQRDEQARVNFNNNVDRSLHAVMSGARSVESRFAYDTLRNLNPQDPQARALVQSIVYSQDPGSALLHWWDNSGVREHVIGQLTGQDQQQDRGREERRPAPRRSRERDRYEEPRHEIRPARPLRSLNSASGGGSHRVSNPEMLDGSEGSVFDFATRK
jgi:hypothetical protein